MDILNHEVSKQSQNSGPLATIRSVVNSPEQPTALEAVDLSKRYGSRHWALRGVSVAIPTGRITGLVGPNAAGKSTLLRTWLGFETPTSGLVRVDGLDPARRSAEARARVGYVPQMAQVYSALTVDEHLGLVALLRDRFHADRARERLEQLAIPLTARGDQLSGGQEAQLVLALALGADAPILLLDEPLAHLDPLARREFLKLVRNSVEEEGRTVVLSSHVVSDVEQACDDLLVLGVGRVLMHSSLAAALATHAVTPAGADTPDLVADFGASDGSIVRLVARAPGGPEERSATLEEIVLGHLASARTAA